MVVPYNELILKYDPNAQVTYTHFHRHFYACEDIHCYNVVSGQSKDKLNVVTWWM